MSFLDAIIYNLPEVAPPKQKKLSFNQKFKYTIITLIAFFILGVIPLFGLASSALQNFQFLELVLGASMGSIISLGIGPIVTASIVLQLLNGAGFIKIDTSTEEGKARYQGIQKLLSIFFILFEAIIYVSFGGLRAMEGVPNSVLVFQLFLGGFLVLLMDELITKWGFGSGISLFIAAGVSKRIFVQLLNPIKREGSQYSIGFLWQVFQGLRTGAADVTFTALLTIISTIIVFLVVVFTQAMKVEIPLSFGRVRGHGLRWPLNFFYTSNIPVILVAALIANIQLVAQLVGGANLVTWVRAPNLLHAIVGGSLSWGLIARSLVYIFIFVIGSVIFGFFWVQTAGLDAKSQAKQIMASGLQIPGFRKDPRVLERILDRYIKPLTFMGSVAVGLLASIADLTGAMGSGTGILLTVMIVYRLYEEIAQQHLMDLNPAMRKFLIK